MKAFLFLLIATSSISMFISCGNSDRQQTFCDTACFGDSLNFTGDHPLKPWLSISASKCEADTIAWSYEGMGANRMVGISDFLDNEVRINKNFIRVVFNDTSAVLVMFNDCRTGRGYQVKLPFNKTGLMGRKSSAINSLDPKFHVDESLLAYTDRGNIYVEEIKTGKTAMMTFGEALDIDYDAIHEHIDSVHITPQRIWVKVLIDEEWKELEKKIVLEDNVQ